MKNSIKTLAVLLLLAVAGNAAAQISATATGTANGTVICPMTLSKTADLNFGTIAGDGTVTVDPNDATGAATVYTGNATQYHGSNTHTEPLRAWFALGGQAGFHFHINPAVVSEALPLAMMNGAVSGGSVNNFTTNYATEASQIFPADNGGCVSIPLYVGATYTIPVNTAPGTYSATFTINVHYN